MKNNKEHLYSDNSGNLDYKYYLYPNGTMKNKLGTKDKEILFLKEYIETKESIEKNVMRIPSMIKNNALDDLKDIHKMMFENVYDWAGELRKVNISKNNYLFLPIKLFNNTSVFIADKNDKTFDEIIDTYNELNIMHPFREGNGRAIRIWLNAKLQIELGVNIDFSLLPKDDYMKIMISSHDYDTKYMKEEFKKLLIPINDQTYLEIFNRNLDASYVYEGYKSSKEIAEDAHDIGKDLFNEEQEKIREERYLIKTKSNKRKR